MDHLTVERPMQILLVEDDAFDEAMTKKYLKKGLTNYELHVVHDGDDALDFIRGKGKYENQEKPDLILLDLGLPRVNGSEVLKAMKDDPELGGIPVVVLTGQPTSTNPIQKFRLGENCYMNKWINMGDFLAILKAVDDFRNEVD